jgi:hypothetical protein
MTSITVEVKEEVWHDPIEDAELVILRFKNPEELMMAAHEGVTDIGLWKKKAGIAVPLHVQNLVEYLMQRREIITAKAVTNLLCHSLTVLPILEGIQEALDLEYCEAEDKLHLQGGEQV